MCVSSARADWLTQSLSDLSDTLFAELGWGVGGGDGGGGGG